MTDLATVEGVELAAVGVHNCLTGEWNCTPQDIQDAVAASLEPDWRAPVIKLGHTDPRFDGQPAVGTIRNLRPSADGQKLLGDLADMPQWLIDVLPAAYPSRSVEGLRQAIAASGKAYSFRLTALALLGVEPPAIESLADVARMYQVAAAHSQQAQGVGSPVVTVPNPPVAAAAAVPTHQKGAGMSPEQLREELGLDPGASEIEVAAKLAALNLIPKMSEPVPEPTPDPEPEPEPAAKADDIMSHPIVAELRNTVKDLTGRLEAREQADAAKERDQFLESAVAAGRLRPADREHFTTLYTVDPDTTKAIIMARKGGSELPVGSNGHEGNPEPDISDPTIAAFETAFPDPDRKAN